MYRFTKWIQNEVVTFKVEKNLATLPTNCFSTAFYTQCSSCQGCVQLLPKFMMILINNQTPWKKYTLNRILKNVHNKSYLINTADSSTYLIADRAHSHDIRFYYKSLGMIQFYHPQNYKESSTKLKNHSSYK